MSLFNISAVVASIMVLLIAIILVPNQSWNATTITSVIVFAGAFGFVFYVPNIVIKRQDKSNAAQLASLGPLGVIAGWMLLLTAGAFVLAVSNFSKLALALDVFAIGGFIISSSMLNSALNVINTVSEQNVNPSKHFTWQITIQSLCPLSTEKNSKNSLEKLAEKLRYMASDIIGGSPQDAQIENAIQEIADQLSLNGSNDIQNIVSKIEMLIAQRDVYLRSARSKA